MSYVTKEEVECKGCGRIIHRNELQYDSPEGRICSYCYARTHKWHDALIFKRLKVVGEVILLLVFLGLVLVAVLFVILVFFLGANIGDALVMIGLLINPFLIFEIFGWIGVGVWFVIWFVIAVVVSFGFARKS